MAIRVRGPDGVVNNFPDGTPDSVITQAMAAHYGAPAPATGDQRQAQIAAQNHARIAAENAAARNAPLVDPITETANAFSGGFNRLKAATGNWFQQRPPPNSGPATFGALGEMATAPITGLTNALYVDPVSKVTGIPKATVAGSLAAVLPEGAPLTAPAAAATATAPPTTAVSRLRAAGVPVLPGQRLGGIFKAGEEKATSLPILGDAISGAAARGRAGLNQAFAQRALSPVGEALPAGIKPGHDTIAHVQQVLGAKYDAAGKLIANVQPDQQFGADLSNIGDALKDYPKAVQDQFMEIVKNRVIDPLSSGSGSGDQFIGITSQIRKLASKYSGSTDGADRGLADALGDLHSAITDLGARQNPAYGQAKAQVDQGYATFKQLQRAGQAAGTRDGVATPAQLKAAVRNSDDSVDNGRFAAGTALNQDLVRDADQVMGGNYPDSGTAGRLAVNAMALGGGSALAPHLTVPAAAGLSAASIPYLATGRLGNAFQAAGAAAAPLASSPIAKAAMAAFPPPTIVLGGAMGSNAFRSPENQTP